MLSLIKLSVNVMNLTGREHIAKGRWSRDLNYLADIAIQLQ